MDFFAGRQPAVNHDKQPLNSDPGPVFKLYLQEHPQTQGEAKLERGKLNNGSSLISMHFIIFIYQ